MDNFPGIADYILIFIFGIILPFVSGIRSAKVFKEITVEFDSATKRRFYIGNSFMLFVVAAVILLVWGLYKRPYAELGLASPSSLGKLTPWWLVGLFVFMYTLDLVYSMNDPTEREKTVDQMDNQTPFMPTKVKELPAYVLMCISAGVFEEIVFRGYMINFFRYLMNDVPYMQLWAVLVPSVLFSIAHYYQGAKAVFKILVLSMLFGMIFWHSGSLIVVIILHFLLDLVGGLLSVYMSKNKQKS